MAGEPLPLEGSPAKEMVRDGGVLLVPRATAEILDSWIRREERPLLAQVGLTSHLVVPMRADRAGLAIESARLIDALRGSAERTEQEVRRRSRELEEAQAMRAAETLLEAGLVKDAANRPHRSARATRRCFAPGSRRSQRHSLRLDVAGDAALTGDEVLPLSAVHDRRGEVDALLYQHLGCQSPVA